MTATTLTEPGTRRRPSGTGAAMPRPAPGGTRTTRRPAHGKRRVSREPASTRPGVSEPPPPLRRTPIPLREPVDARRLLDHPARAPLRVTQEAFALAPPDDHEEIAPPPPSPTAPVVPATDREWVTRFVHAATEVSSGLRSASQLIRWTTPDIQQALQRRAALAGRARNAGVYRTGKPFVRSLRISVVRAGVYEVTAVVGELDRIRAIALRMQDLDGRWRVTALEMG